MQYKYTINKNTNFSKQTLLDIQNIFENSDESIHKARNEIKIIEIDGVKFVVKSFKVPHFINKVAYSFFRDSKAKRSYFNSLALKAFAPIPLAYIEFYENFLLTNSYFFSEYYEYDFTMKYPLLDKKFPDRTQILQEFAGFTYQLHQNNIYHIDYSPGNILVKKVDDTFEFKIVDVNRMKFLPLGNKERAKNFAKLSSCKDDLKIIADSYCKHFKKAENFYSLVVYYSKKHQNKNRLKNKIRGQ